MATRLPTLLERAILFAHRGVRAGARDHVVDALAVAQRLGATGLRVEAWQTADGVTVIDRSGLARRFPRRRISEVAHATIEERFATVDDVLSVADGSVWVSAVDDETARAVATAARRAGVVDRLWLGHPDLETLARWRDLEPDVKLVNETSIAALPVGPERRAAELAAARVEAVALPEDDWSGGLVTLFHRFEVATFAEGAHFERQLARLIDMGIDAVSGDHPDRMAAVAATFD